MLSATRTFASTTLKRSVASSAPNVVRLSCALPRPTSVLASRLTRLAFAPSLQQQQQRAFALSAPRRSGAAVQNDPKWKNGEKVTYEELKPLTQSPDDSGPVRSVSQKILLIDVREPNEVALGSIPSSVNLPLSTFEKSLAMDEGDFTRVNGFHKPSKQQPMIFYCRAGVRAQTAVDLAKAAGYKWSRNYEGSYLDWQKHEESNPNKDD
ncbi:hypothetical protein JCM10908_000637 [Rhodotorula pacifica]|uniref:uncharacterized protein n=1 Tax=Rhodotorula pacifica TaxID=1495444 RepID=UPI0031804425